MEESTKTKIHQLEIVAAVVLLLVSVVSFFPNRGITGYVSVETKKQEIDLTIANSQSYILTTRNKEPFYFTSLKLSGEVIRSGIAKAYISAKNQKILIYSNVIKKDEGLNSITGMGKITGNVVRADSETEEAHLVIEHLENIEEVPKSITEEEKVVSGSFEGMCIDSCFTEILLKEDTAYQLLLYVEEGTVLNINEIIYTIRRD
jgi:hypothetical protein